MSDLEMECWIHFDGPAPASVRPLMDALREAAAPTPSAEAKERAFTSFLAALDARLEGRPAPAAIAAPPAAVAPPPPPPFAPAMGFEAWAEISLGLLGLEGAAKLEALRARGLPIEAWTRADEHYLRLLSDDLRSGRAERPALYQALCSAEVARRKGVSPIVSSSLPAVRRAPAELRETTEAFELPAALRASMGALPFKPDAPGAPACAEASARTLRVPVGLRGTMGIGDDAIQKAVAAVPFAAGAPSSVVPIPALTVEQYVSLEHDLAMNPAKRAETLCSYGVPNEASLRALQDDWQRRAAADPALKAAIAAAADRYLVWARSLQR